MKYAVEERAVMLGEYIIENKATVRGTAKQFGISKRSCCSYELAATASFYDCRIYISSCNFKFNPK